MGVALVPIKLYLQKQVESQSWHMGRGLLTPVSGCSIVQMYWNVFIFQGAFMFRRTRATLWPVARGSQACSAPCPLFGPELLDDATPFWKAHPQAGIRTALVRGRPDSSKPSWAGPSREFFRPSRRTRRCPTTHISTALRYLGDIVETGGNALLSSFRLVTVTCPSGPCACVFEEGDEVRGRTFASCRGGGRLIKVTFVSYFHAQMESV